MFAGDLTDFARASCPRLTAISPDPSFDFLLVNGLAIEIDFAVDATLSTLLHLFRYCNPLIYFQILVARISLFVLTNAKKPVGI